MRWIRNDAAYRLPFLRSALLLAALLVSIPAAAYAQASRVQVASGDGGLVLQVDGEPFFVKGVNWDYFPVGTTTSYNFWGQPDDFVREALDREMSLLKAMGGNAIRVYNGIPARWVRYIYEEYGIWSVVNHPVGRYGVTLNGRYIPQTDYSNPAARAQIAGEVMAVVDELQGTPGLLMWLLGNENNYGLEWSSAETEDLPQGERYRANARHLYSLMGELVDAIHARNTGVPVAMANGDLQYLDVIAEEVPNLDIFGSNVYRGISFRDFFEAVDQAMGIPVLFTEFGADAFNARTFREDQVTQARYLIGQWEEIYANTAGKGLTGNAIGGLTFQWSDGWWKFGQEDRLDIHDTNASWANDAYPEDFVDGANNMNEEWWGIAAKGPTDAAGHYQLYPRAAYYALREAYELDPYAPGTDLDAVQDHFDDLNPVAAELQARGDRAALQSATMSLARVSGIRMEFETYSTGGERISTPEQEGVPGGPRPAFQGFDTKESFYADFESNPAPNVQANLSLNVLGSVPTNPIDEIFYENVGRRRLVASSEGALEVNDFERVRVYRANVSWEEARFRVDGFYRTGHYHWGYEGDFFNLYREANYGPNLDIYNGVAPVGMELTGKRELEGLAVAYGPELWWGANPAILAKYTRDVAGVQVTGVVQEDLERAADIVTSFAVPAPKNRKATLHLATTVSGVGIDVGGIWAGSPLVGRTFQIADEVSPGNYRILQDEVKEEDAFGGKLKLTYQRGPVSWYALGSATGIVADGGYDQTQTFTGWTLKDNGSGNQWQILSGFSYRVGMLEIAPNFMWQKPIVGPIPASAPAPARPRNILDDPFSVRVNRETTAGELVLTWDPTPATWMYLWDSDAREDAEFAVSAGFVFRRHHTTADAGIGILGDGRTPFAFPGATPARDLWETNVRVVSKQANGLGLVLKAYYGIGEPNGDSQRDITRYGGDVRIIRGPVKFEGFAKFNDWGPYDYHRDFNLTFPMQLMGDVSWSLGTPDWFPMIPGTRLGIRGVWRTLDQYSPRYCPGFTTGPSGSPACNANLPGEDGREWEIRTYLQVGM
ncbi:MAG TPA: hypothetical protein VLA43_09190 [Longimicrobiales bacterium]|nr:hypothetical protein [Longimicrobiales bacterium]